MTLNSLLKGHSSSVVELLAWYTQSPTPKESLPKQKFVMFLNIFAYNLNTSYPKL